MSGLPDRIVSGERVVAVVVALVLIVAVVAGVWATGRGTSGDDEPVAVASPSAAQTSTAAILAAVDETEQPGEPSPSPGEPSPSSTKAAGKANGASAEDASSGSGSGSGSASGSSSSGGSSASKASGTSTPTPTPTKTRKATPTPTPTKTAQAASVPSAAHFSVTGKVDKTTYFTVAALKKMRLVSESYFSRGKDPKEASNAFVGVRLIDILNAAGLTKSATRVTITAADDYSASFSLRQVKAAYMDETRSGVSLPMIIAFSEDGSAYTGDHPFRLVMGQTIAGDYNRQYWVRLTVSITVL